MSRAVIFAILMLLTNSECFAKECPELDYFEAFQKNFGGTSGAKDVKGTISSNPSETVGYLYLTFTLKNMKGKDVPYIGYTKVNKTDFSLMESWIKELAPMNPFIPPRAFGCVLNIVDGQPEGCKATDADKACHGKCTVAILDGDIILGVNELKIKSLNDMMLAMRKLNGEHIDQVTVRRSGKDVTLKPAY